MNLVLMKIEGLVEDTKVKHHFGCSDHEMVKFRTIQILSNALSKTGILYFRRPNSEPF